MADKFFDRKLLGEIGKFAASVGLKTLHASARVVEFMAMAMVEDELGPQEWEKLSFPEKKQWRGRARAAIAGLNRAIYESAGG